MAAMDGRQVEFLHEGTHGGDMRERYPELLDSKQAAGILNVNERTVTRMCAAGKLKAVKVMSLWRINRDALLDFAGLN